MALAFNGTSSKAVRSGTIASAYPFTLFCWMKPASSSTNYHVMGTGDFGGAAMLGILASGADTGKVRAFSRDDGGGSVYPESTTSISTAWTPVMVVFTSSTSRTVYYGAGAAVTDTNANAPTLSGFDRFVVGLSSLADNTFFSGDIAHPAVWTSALTQGNFDSLAAGAVPNTIASGSLWDYWSFNAAGASATGVNGNVLTFTSLSVAATDPLSSGSTAQGATLTATASMFGGTATGGAATGTFTSEVLKRNNGTVAASSSLTYVRFYNTSTGALVVAKTGLSTNGSGIFTTTDALLVPGTTYGIDWEESGGQRRMPRKAAT